MKKMIDQSRPERAAFNEEELKLILKGLERAVGGTKPLTQDEIDSLEADIVSIRGILGLALFPAKVV